ncbi:MAG: OmpA family protein [Reyranella sp.]|nr:OmpA family protein [Reyranella sp.]
MGSAALSDATRRTVSIFAETCAPPKDSTKLIIAVTGHTDVTGEEQANLSLAVARAEAVKRFLVSLHIAAPSIVVNAVGAKQPFATGSQPSLNDKEGVVTMHAMNRRVSLERRLQ